MQVEDLFYNVPTRRKALTSKHEVHVQIWVRFSVNALDVFLLAFILGI